MSNSSRAEIFLIFFRRFFVIRELMVKSEQRCEFVLKNKNKKDQSGADCETALSAKGKMLCSFVKFSQRILLENVLRSA